jgi:hypothetical protein
MEQGKGKRRKNVIEKWRKLSNEEKWIFLKFSKFSLVQSGQWQGNLDFISKYRPLSL